MSIAQAVITVLVSLIGMGGTIGAALIIARIQTVEHLVNSYQTELQRVNTVQSAEIAQLRQLIATSRHDDKTVPPATTMSEGDA